MNKLPIPPDVIGDDQALEMLQAWIGKGQIHVSLNLGVWEDSPDQSEEAVWGNLLADIAYHIANGLSDQTGKNPTEIIKEIKKHFIEEIEDPQVDHFGSFLSEQ